MVQFTKCQSGLFALLFAPLPAYFEAQNPFN